MTKRQNYLDKETAEDAAYCIHMMAATNDPDERERLAARLFRDLPIDQSARDLGKEICTHVLAQRAKKSRQDRRQRFSVQDIVSHDADGRLRLDRDKLAVAHSDTVSQVLAAVRGEVAALLARQAVQA